MDCASSSPAREQFSSLQMEVQLAETESRVNNFVWMTVHRETYRGRLMPPHLKGVGLFGGFVAGSAGACELIRWASARQSAFPTTGELAASCRTFAASSGYWQSPSHLYSRRVHVATRPASVDERQLVQAITFRLLTGD